MTQAGRGPADHVEAVIENLVNQIAHDVRNLAFAMGLQAELGARRAFDPIASQEHFEAVVRQVDKLKAYLERLLLFGRPYQPLPNPLDPLALLREVAQQVCLAVPPGGPQPTIQVLAERDVGRVMWDRRGIHAALAAVLDNAVRSAPTPPPVQVTVEQAGERVRITVRDEGSGMNAATLAALHTPMAARRAGGAGLGLAIARKMIKAHGGTLAITSGAEGTSVSIEIPREAAAESV